MAAVGPGPPPGPLARLTAGIAAARAAIAAVAAAIRRTFALHDILFTSLRRAVAHAARGSGGPLTAGYRAANEVLMRLRAHSTHAMGAA